MFTDDLFINIAILVLAVIGFYVSWYIGHKKQRKEKLVCIIGEDCDKVVHSRYSKFLGVPLEIFGMLYYAVVAFLSILLLMGIGSIGALTVICILIGIGALAVLFSIALIYIQAYIIKEWCEYCLASAGISILIFALEIVLAK